MKTESLLRIDRLTRRLIALSVLSQEGEISELSSDEVSEVLIVQQEAAREIQKLVGAELRARSS